MLESILEIVETTSGMDWYCCKVKSGSESRTRLDLKSRSFYLDLEQYFGKMLIPLEWASTTGGKLRSQKLYPGYLFLEMVLNTDTYWLVRNLPKVQEFGERNGHPIPISIDYMNRMLLGMFEGIEVQLKTIFVPGDEILVEKGPFASFKGSVLRVAEPKVVVALSIMGRPVETHLDFNQISKNIK